eukprot:symbB.v1.2.013089.t2/scaffold919.1/size152209/1
MQTFPEMGLWRELRQAIQTRVWDTTGEPIPQLPQEQDMEESTKRSKSRRRSRSRKRSRSRSRRRREKDRDRGRGNLKEDGTYEIDDGRRHREDTNWYEKNPIGSRGRGPMAERERKRDLAWDSRWTTSEDDGPKPEKKAAEEPPPEEVSRDPREVIAVHPQGYYAGKWARKWRSAMAAILPSSFDSAAPLTDTEVRKLGFLLWKDIASWAEHTEMHRYLGLFRADHQSSKTFGWDGKELPGRTRGLEPSKNPPDWSFVPVTDLFLVVGEGLVGITTEGIFAEKPKGQGRSSGRSQELELETDPPSAISILHEDRAMKAQEKLPHGDEISVQLLLQNVIGRWTRHAGIKPKKSWVPVMEEIYDYKEEILLLRKDGQGRYKKDHGWVRDQTSHGSRSIMIGCFREDLKGDEDMHDFLNSSATGASWQLRTDECEPVIFIRGKGWYACRIFQDDDLVLSEGVKVEDFFSISLRELQDSWEFCTESFPEGFFEVPGPQISASHCGLQAAPERRSVPQGCETSWRKAAAAKETSQRFQSLEDLLPSKFETMEDFVRASKFARDKILELQEFPQTDLYVKKPPVPPLNPNDPTVNI